MSIKVDVRSRVSCAGRFARRGVAVAAVGLALTACGWRGIANVPIPGGTGTTGGHWTIYAQMPDTLALNVNSQVRVADVNVGTVRAIELKNWVATLKLDIQPNLKLPKNATAKIGQTSLLGSQHVELAAPTNPSPQLLQNGDTISLKNTEAFPSTERVLAALSMILRGGGIPNLEVIQNELFNIVTGREDQIREFLNKLDTFTGELNKQSQDLVHAIDSSNRLLTVVAQNNDTLDRILTEAPPVIKHFADTRDLFADAIVALGRLSTAADNALAPTSDNLHTNLDLLQPALRELGKASPYLVGALKLILTAPFNIENVPKVVRGDYINVSLLADLTLSAIDNGELSGTGVSGMLRALEQSWGRDPATMIPDVRFTPNPHDAPNGPLVERGG
ncbi:MAG: MCE family protein [Mycobacteriaceae bacterium]|nr:MCE family protein [Mycobacteriaceae bacterium]